MQHSDRKRNYAETTYCQQLNNTSIKSTFCGTCVIAVLLQTLSVCSVAWQRYSKYRTQTVTKHVNIIYLNSTRKSSRLPVALCLVFHPLYKMCLQASICRGTNGRSLQCTARNKSFSRVFFRNNIYPAGTEFSKFLWDPQLKVLVNRPYIQTRNLLHLFAQVSFKIFLTLRLLMLYIYIYIWSSQ